MAFVTGDRCWVLYGKLKEIWTFGVRAQPGAVDAKWTRGALWALSCSARTSA
jgi:hypothetical protein